MRKWLKFGLPGLIAVVLMTVALVPSWREGLRSHFSHIGQEVLATAEGDLLNDGTVAKVIKYRSGDSIYVEVMRLEANGNTKFVDRVLLPDKHDGLFNFQGHVTRLAIADIDNDGKQVLLAPTFDNQLVPHLNVFRYNPALGRVEPYTPSR